MTFKGHEADRTAEPANRGYPGPEREKTGFTKTRLQTDEKTHALSEPMISKGGEIL